MGGGNHDNSESSDKGFFSNLAHGYGGYPPHGQYPPAPGAYPQQGYPPQGYPPSGCPAIHHQATRHRHHRATHHQAILQLVTHLLHQDTHQPVIQVHSIQVHMVQHMQVMDQTWV